MELITILSTIILIATISTFILSVGAYILFKVRSRRQEKASVKIVPSTNAELVTVDNFQLEESSQPVEKTSYSRVNGETQREKREHQRIPASRYTKYSSEEKPAAGRDYKTGDLQWK